MGYKLVVLMSNDNEKEVYKSPIPLVVKLYALPIVICHLLRKEISTHSKLCLVEYKMKHKKYFTRFVL